MVVVWINASQLAKGHGVAWTVQDGSRAVSVFYEDGPPLAEAEVTVFAPNDPAPWHSATTDPNGRFAFVPDRAGRWRLVVHDGMGHGETILIDIRDDLSLHTAPPPTRSRGLALLAGIGIILGLSGLAAAFRASKRAKS